MTDPPPQGGLGQSWFVLDFVATYGEEPKITGGASPRGTFGPAFAREEKTWSFAGETSLRRNPVPVLVLASVFGTVELQRRRAFAFAGQREPAHRIVMARRDDEEFLLIL